MTTIFSAGDSVTWADKLDATTISCEEKFCGGPPPYTVKSANTLAVTITAPGGLEVTYAPDMLQPAGILAGLSATKTFTKSYQSPADSRPEYDGPDRNPIEEGFWVKFVAKSPWEKAAVAKWEEEMGKGPYKVVCATNADELRDPETKKPYKVDSRQTPMVWIHSTNGSDKVSSYGYRWFKRVLAEGDLCHVCWHIYAKRMLFFSTYMGCWCPEEKEEP